MRSLDTSLFTSLLGGQGNGSMSSSQKGTLVVKMRDVDGDGALTSREAGISSTRFKRTDVNGDGQLTAEEIAKDMARPTTDSSSRVDLSSLARSLLARRDADRSGGMTADEGGWKPGQLGAVDKDGDGELDASELADHLEKNLPQHLSRSTSQGAPRTYRSMALEGAMSLLGGAGSASPWYSSPSEPSNGWFG